MRELLNLVLTGLLIVSVNILSITITCFMPSYGSDGHFHTLFHLFERADAHAAHSQTHPDAHTEDHENCSFDAHSNMTMLASIASCDLCVAQESQSLSANDATVRIAFENPISLYTFSLSPPPEPPELS